MPRMYPSLASFEFISSNLVCEVFNGVEFIISANFFIFSLDLVLTLMTLQFENGRSQ